MSRLRHARRHRLSFESLEGRRVLAGSVSVTQSGGDLLISGGTGSTITVESAGAGVIQVRGYTANGGVTNVNGQANGTLIFSGVTNLSAGLGDNGLLRVTNLVLPGNVTISNRLNSTVILGQGEVTSNTYFGGTASGPLYVQGNLRVTSRYAYVSDAHVNQAATFLVNRTDGSLLMQRPSGSTANVEVAGLLTINSATSPTVNLTGLVVDDDVIVNPPSSGDLNFSLNSADISQTLFVYGGEFEDQVNISALNAKTKIYVNTAGANDSIIISAITPVSVIDAGNGSDHVQFTQSNMGTINVKLGAGNDTGDVLDSVFNHVYGYGGDGQDLFNVRNVDAFDAYFYGEAGFDTYRESTLQPNSIDYLRLFTIEDRQTINSI